MYSFFHCRIKLSKSGREIVIYLYVMAANSYYCHVLTIFCPQTKYMNQQLFSWESQYSIVRKALTCSRSRTERLWNPLSLSISESGSQSLVTISSSTGIHSGDTSNRFSPSGAAAGGRPSGYSCSSHEEKEEN